MILQITSLKVISIPTATVAGWTC